jgi:hypothetical protein
MTSKAVRADTPDPTKYHPNRGGMPGTMIPRAGKDGESLGFDPNRPQTVIVDPGEIGGGFTLNISELSKVKKNFNSAAVRADVAGDVTSFYRELSERMKDKEEVQTQPKKEKPVAETLKPLPSLPALNPLPANPLPNIPAVGPADLSGEIEKLLANEAAKSSQARAQLLSPPNQDVLQNMALQQNVLLNALVDRVNQLTAERIIPVATKPEVEKKPEPVEDKPQLDLQFVLDSLQIPFFKGPTASRPQYETYFEMAKMGTMAARYHAVVAGQDCLALVYDTRFEDGFQYLPPNLGDERITVSVPKLKAVYNCSSLGLHWTLGCLDVVILIRHEGEQQ